MSLGAKFEFILNFVQFKNIDLFNQGNFYLTFTLQHEQDKKILKAIPYMNHKSEKPDTRPNEILEEEFAYQTSTFTIRFQEEKVFFKDFCQFRLDLPRDATGTLQLLCDLYFAPLGQKEFSKVSQKVLNLHNYDTLQEFVPLTFGSEYFCQATLLLQSYLYNFKFFPKNNNFFQDETDEFCTYLSTQTNNFEPQKIDLFYRAHIEKLINLYQKNLHFFKQMHHKCREQFKIPPYNFKELEDSPQQQTIKDLLLTHKKDHKNQKQISTFIQQQLYVFGLMLFKCIHLLVTFINRYPLECARLLLQTYRDFMKFQQTFFIRFDRSVVRDIYTVTDFTQFNFDLRKNQRIITQYRQKLNKQKMAQDEDYELLNVQDTSLGPCPLLYDEIYQLKTDKTSILSQIPQTGQHLVVLVHGFQGNRYDMRGIKNNLLLVNPHTLILVSESNEKCSSSDISLQAHNLTTVLDLLQEIKSFITEYCQSLQRLSFIGHSMGGVVIRAALPLLQEFKSKMFTYVSLSSPHLGYFNHTKQYINLGMWVIKKLQKLVALDQISSTDQKKVEDSFLFKLSQHEVALVGSTQDTYAPYESSTIQLQKKGQKDYHAQMVQNLMGRMESTVVHRINVNFEISTKQCFDVVIWIA